MFVKSPLDVTMVCSLVTECSLEQFGFRNNLVIQRRNMITEITYRKSFLVKFMISRNRAIIS